MRGLVNRQPDNAFETSRTHYYHVSDNFVRNMKELVEGPTSLIHFNALRGDIWDIEPLIERSRGWFLEDWESEYDECSPSSLSTVQLCLHGERCS
jgi:hypothetical protein